MSGLDDFWAHIDDQIERLKTAKTAADVIGILDAGSSSAGAAFFAGSGGDDTVLGSLQEAGWLLDWYEADYYWAATSPDGESHITYVEGDVYPELQPDPSDGAE